MDHVSRSRKNTLWRRFLVVVGTVFVGLAALGVVLPLLPTTPFLLVAAACYARGSDRFSNWLLGNRVFGKALQDYREGRGLPLRVKVPAIALLWITIGLSAAFGTDNLAVRIIVLLIAAGVTIHLVRVPTSRRS
jgi:uncharacterized membrane protein YbaN (DUF454 family)